MKIRKPTVAESISKFSMPEPNTGCWLWTGSLDHRGYARITVDAKNKLASRVSYELHKGKITNSLLVCHTCDVPSCVNPDHLYLGTPHQNSMDAVRRGRRPIPVRKLTEEDVSVIKKRLDSGETQTKIAKDYNVHHCLIGNIKQGKIWKNVESGDALDGTKL